MEKIQISTLEKKIRQLYGNDKSTEEYQNNRLANLLQSYYVNYDDGSDISIISTPGRTEISGNHTDHNGGKVIAASINLDTVVCVSRNEDSAILKSDKYSDTFHVDLKDLEVKSEEIGTTNAIIRGIAAGFVKHGYKVGGFKGVLTSDVMQGSGLSSSASIEVAVGSIFNALYNNNKVPPDLIARIGQYAENNYFGKPCGLMDQIACAVGGVVTIDFEDNENPLIQKIDFNLSEFDYKLLVVDTGGTHQNLTEDYASIPNEMKEVAKYFGKVKCSQIDLPSLLENGKDIREKVSDRAVLRAYHFLKENIRVEMQVKALKENRLDQFLDLVKQSGDSSFKYVQNIYSNNNVDEQPLSLALAITENYIEKINCGACRVHGGGFAGTIQVFLPQNYADNYITQVEKLFGKDSVSTLDIRPYGSFMIHE